VFHRLSRLEKIESRHAGRQSQTPAIARNAMAASGRSVTVGIRPKPVDHRIEKRPFNACVLR